MNRIYHLPLFLLTMAFLTTTGQAQIHTVSIVPGLADYTTLDEAIDAAQGGDTIFLYPGNYGTITINKTLCIIGVGYRKEENGLQGSLTTSLDAEIIEVLIENTSDVKINSCLLGDLRLENSPGGVINRCYVEGYINIISSNDVVFSGCFLHEAPLQHEAFRLNNSQNFYMTNSIIDRYVSTYVRFWIDDNSNAFFNHVIFDGREYGIQNSLVKNCIFLNTGGNSTIDNGFGNNNFVNNVTQQTLNPNTDIVMTFSNIPIVGNSDPNSTYDGRYQLLPNSIASGAADDGTDCGAFGGNLPYQLSGLPTRPLIHELNLPSNATTGSPLPIYVKVRTQN